MSAVLSVIPALPSRARKLHAGHFAFMRAVVQGIDTRAAWERYLRIEGEHDDIRLVRKTIAWMRDEFAVAAKRSDRHGTARLILIDVAAISEVAPALPSLEDFARERGLDEFSEAEQLEAYQDEFGTATQRQSRRARLMARQLDALRWLEQLVAQPPLSGDAVASWFHPDLVRYLEGAGIFTLRQLVERINGIGRRWYAGIGLKAIGQAKAGRIEDWLRSHEATIGVTLGKHVSVQRSRLYRDELQRVTRPATAIVPIEKFVVPAELDGSQGRFRAPPQLCLLKANNDYEAILVWIRSRRGLDDVKRAEKKIKRGLDPASPEGPLEWLQYLSHTQRSYLREVERFLLWSIIQHKKPLSSMTLDDCHAYAAFLADPAPADLWCGPRGRGEKWSPLWRPFEGPLSASAQRQSLIILKAFYKFLVDQCYLVGNPWNGVTLPRASKVRAERSRSLTQAQWQFVQSQIAQLPDTSANRRLSLTLHLLYATGLRLAEAVSARVDDLEHVTYPPDQDDDEPVEGWELRVVGKGGKERIVPVPYEVTSELAHYLKSRGLDIDPLSPANRGAHLIGKVTDIAERHPWSIKAGEAVDPKAGVSAQGLYDQLKRFFQDCADVLAYTDDKGASKLRQASTHWLRHTHGSHAVAAGIPLEVIQQNMGHASLNTTTRYVTSEDKRRLKMMQKLWKG